MKNVLTIIKKEFTRFFKDKRLVITVLMPGFLIFAIYSIIGSFVHEDETPVSDGVYSAYVVNMPTDSGFSSGVTGFLDQKEGYTIDSAKSAVKDGELDLLIIFSENFDKVLSGEETGGKVEIFYNSTNTDSINGYNVLSGVINQFDKKVFEINSGEGYNLADIDKFAGEIYAMMMPLIMFSLIASGCVSIAPESIAGEKERGTIATLLITPIKRWQLALGKVISSAGIAMLSGISSFIGVVLSMPKLMGVSVSYSFGQYVLLLLLILSVVAVIITAFSALSTFAKSVKEASTFIVPVMIVMILLGVVPLAIPSPALGLYAIPLIGSALAISATLSATYSVLGFVLSIISNVVVSAALIVLISYMFNKEKIMFNNN